MTDYHRLLYIIHLIHTSKVNQVQICSRTKWSRSTVQRSLSKLNEIGVRIEFIGAPKTGYYELLNPGSVNMNWIEENIETIQRKAGVDNEQ